MVTLAQFLAAASTTCGVTSNSTPPGRQDAPQPLATFTVESLVTQAGCLFQVVLLLIVLVAHASTLRALHEYDHVSYVRSVALMICLPWIVEPVFIW